MRPLLVFFTALILVLPSVWAHDFEHSPSAGGNADVARYEIGYSGADFEPRRLQVKPGSHVVFINRSSDYVWPASNIHPTHEIYPGFDSKMGLEPGQSWSFVFDRPGEWRFHNHLQPSQGGIIVVLGTESTVAGGLTEQAEPELLRFEPMAALTPEHARLLFDDNDFLVEAIKIYGPAAVVQELSRIADGQGVHCHERAHLLGRLAYQQFGATAFSLSGHECQSGSFHGVTEAMFHERGTSDIASDVQKICAGMANSFFHHQCVHGIGHGLMAWTNYELPDALAICANLETPQRGPRDAHSCYSGVFMENVEGGLSGAMGHFTSYLSDDDVHYPCNVLDKKYVRSCYTYQTSHMLSLFGHNFRDLAVACAEAPDYARRDCYASMGRDVGGQTRGRADLAIEYCGYLMAVPKQRLECIAGAVQQWFWEARGAEPALEFCRTVSDTGAKDRCYSTILRRAKHILNPDEMRHFCAAIEPGYHMRIPVGELFSRAISSLNPFADNHRSPDEISGYEACRRPAPQLDLLTSRIASWFGS
ncbi:MAG: cupredoxin domain-containing protein [Planctomycetota bacterium]